MAGLLSIVQRRAPSAGCLVELERLESSNATFLGLPCDCIHAVLVRIAGDPPEVAIVLAQVACCCQQLRAQAEEAATGLVRAHMCVARLELAHVRRALPTALGDLDLDGPVTAAPSSLVALWGQLPRLPLQWTLLRNSVTDMSSVDEADMADSLAACELDATAVKGTVRITWPPPAALQPVDDSSTEEDYIRELPLRSRCFAPVHVASHVGLASHPGLIARWRVPSRRASLCPCCQRWRRHSHAQHRAWAPDAMDQLLLGLPASLEKMHAEHAARLVSRGSARDAEEFERHEFVSIVEALAVASALKCTCEGGGDHCRYIGVPPQ